MNAEIEVFLSKKLQAMNNSQIHPTAIVDEGAKIGDNTKIWHWCHVSGTASIGANTSLGQNVYIGNNVSIGNQVKIQNNVSVYDCVTLEDEVFCGPSMVFTNVTNPRAAIPRKNEYKATIIRRGATLGANSTIVCGVTVGRWAFIAAGAVVTKDVKEFALMAGVPARQMGWMSRFGDRIPLSLAGKGEWTCPNTKDIYVLDNDILRMT